MAATGFEGFEKRLELRFSGDDPLCLRRMAPGDIEEVLEAVQCSVVSAVGNRWFDAYVLSESSLFVYPEKLIIKTCGTTQLLRSLPILLARTSLLGLQLRWCKYTRGSFIYPAAQPFPHTSFRDEVLFLEQHLPGALDCRKATVLPSKSSHSWHVYSATAGNGKGSAGSRPPHPPNCTIEVCMTQLDRVLASRFVGNTAAGMTQQTGISRINPRAVICDYAFDPCGYSMNALDGDRYSTIHVTPEEECSYASFECVAVTGEKDPTMRDLLRRVVQVFRPRTLSVSVTQETGGTAVLEELYSAIADGVGMRPRFRTADEFAGAGLVTYQIFTARPPPAAM